MVQSAASFSHRLIPSKNTNDANGAQNFTRPSRCFTYSYGAFLAAYILSTPSQCRSILAPSIANPFFFPSRAGTVLQLSRILPVLTFT